MFPVRHVAADFCSKGACEVIATTPHSAAHTGGADFLGTVEPHWARFALSGVLPRSAPMSALCVCVLCASPAALACPLQDDITATSPGLVPAAAQGGRRTRPMALAEPAAGERCRMAAAARPACLCWPARFQPCFRWPACFQPGPKTSGRRQIPSVASTALMSVLALQVAGEESVATPSASG